MVRRQPRETESQRDYRRELDRLWGLSPRREGSKDRDSRRKRKRPSRLQRDGEGPGLSFRDEVLDTEEGSAVPLDLSVTEVASTAHNETVDVDLEPGPSTSRGHSSGLTRLVIPDSGSEDSDGGVVVEEEEEVDVTRPLDRTRARMMARMVAREIVEDILQSVTKERRVRPHDQEADIHISEEVAASYENMRSRPQRLQLRSREPPASTSTGQTFTSQVLSNFLANQMLPANTHQMNQQLPGGFGEKLVFIFVITFTVQDTTPREPRPTSMSCRGWFSSSRPPPAPPPHRPRTRPITPTSRWWTSSLLGLRVNPNPRTLRWWSS